MKKRLNALKVRWTEKLDNILWVVRTTPKKTTSETPFGLVYDSEIAVRQRFIMSSHRVKHFEVALNDEQRRVELDLVEAKRWASVKLQGNMCLATSKNYNWGVSSRQFYERDMVWRINEFAHLDKMNKLSLK